MRLQAFFDELEKIADGAARAEEIRIGLARRFSVSPFLAGSMATGLNVPGKYDYDYAIRIKSRPKFDHLVEQFNQTFKPSPYNKENTDYHVFQTRMGKDPVDIALIYGDKGKAQREALARIGDQLTPERRQEIVQKKQELQDAWFFPALRYKRYKKQVDSELGLPRMKREELKEASLARRDVFGHRTNDLEPLISSNKLLSAVQAARQGALQNYETGTGVGSRERSTKDLPRELRSEIFMTRGLLPPDSAYGRYGVLFRKRQAEPSAYLNTIPEEHTTKSVNSKLTFVVPDQELSTWQKKYPMRTIIPESAVPENKRLQGSSLGTLATRLLTGPKIWQETERV